MRLFIAKNKTFLGPRNDHGSPLLQGLPERPHPTQ